MTGTAGVLLAAKEQGVIAAGRPILESLLAAGCRLRADVIDEVLARAEETG